MENFETLNQEMALLIVVTRMMKNWRLVISGALLFLSGCLVGAWKVGESPGAKRGDSRLLKAKDELRMPLEIEAVGLSSERIGELYEVGGKSPKETMNRLWLAGRPEEMEYVLRGWMEVDLDGADEFLRFPPELWGEGISLRLRAIVWAGRFGEHPGQVMAEVQDLGLHSVDESFYREIILRFGWNRSDELMRQFVFFGKCLENEGDSEKIDDHFQRASVQVFLRWREQALEVFKRSEKPYAEMMKWYAAMRKGPIWSKILREKICAFHICFIENETGYRELFGGG